MSRRATATGRPVRSAARFGVSLFAASVLTVAPQRAANATPAPPVPSGDQRGPHGTIAARQGDGRRRRPDRHGTATHCCPTTPRFAGTRRICPGGLHARLVGVPARPRSRPVRPALRRVASDRRGGPHLADQARFAPWASVGQRARHFGDHDSGERAAGLRGPPSPLAGGRVAYANDVAPRLPSAVAPAVAGVIGLDNLAVYHPEVEIPPASATAGTTGGAAPAAVASPATPQPCAAARAVAAATGAYTADQLAQAYHFDGLYRSNAFGAGVGVALVELGQAVEGDISIFQGCHGTGTQVSYGALDLPNPLRSTIRHRNRWRPASAGPRFPFLVRRRPRPSGTTRRLSRGRGAGSRASGQCPQARPARVFQLIAFTAGARRIVSQRR